MLNRREFTKLGLISLIIPSFGFVKKPIKKIVSCSIITTFNLNPCFGDLNWIEPYDIEKPETEITLNYDDGSVRKFLSYNKHWKTIKQPINKSNNNSIELFTPIFNEKTKRFTMFIKRDEGLVKFIADNLIEVDV